MKIFENHIGLLLTEFQLELKADQIVQEQLIKLLGAN